MGKWLSCLFVNVRVFAYIVLVLTVSQPVYAAVFDCPSGDGSCLIEKVNQANANGEADTIILASGTYSLDVAVDNIEGGNGIPSITSSITINGNGATIERRNNTNTPRFRIFHVANNGELTLTDLTVKNGKNNLYSSHGGGIYNSGGSVYLINCNITLNTAKRHPYNYGNLGGGIYNTGYLRLTNTTVNENEAAHGGGIGNIGTLELFNSTISTNIANGETLPCIDSCVLSGRGGAIYNDGTLKLFNSTISNNEAVRNNYREPVGGIYSNPQINVTNTIVARNIGGTDCNDGIITSGSNNLCSDWSCNFYEPDDLPNTDPLLGPLQDNGGPTKTHALHKDSPAIDKGDDTVCPATDQRGFHRPYGTHCDIGAYEYGFHYSITAAVEGSQTPKVICPPFTGDPIVVKNGKFTITPGGFDPGHRLPLGDGVNEGTSWRFDFKTDPEFQCFPTSLQLASALLTLELTPKDVLISTDAFTIDGLSPIITPTIQNLPVCETSTIQIELTNFYRNRPLLDLLKATHGSIPAFYADDAIVSFAELTLTSFPGEKVNDRFPDLGPEDVDTDFDATPCAENCIGTFTITAEFKNTSSDTLSDLFFEVGNLTGGNVLCNADGGVPWGYGADLTLPMNGGVLKPQESFTVVFEIGLRSMKPFIFEVDLFGKVQK